jgi:hypothetical protein
MHRTFPAASRGDLEWAHTKEVTGGQGGGAKVTLSDPIVSVTRYTLHTHIASHTAPHEYAQLLNVSKIKLITGIFQESGLSCGEVDTRDAVQLRPWPCPPGRGSRCLEQSLIVSSPPGSPCPTEPPLVCLWAATVLSQVTQGKLRTPDCMSPSGCVPIPGMWPWSPPSA